MRARVRKLTPKSKAAMQRAAILALPRVRQRRLPFGYEVVDWRTLSMPFFDRPMGLDLPSFDDWLGLDLPSFIGRTVQISRPIAPLDLMTGAEPPARSEVRTWGDVTRARESFWSSQVPLRGGIPLPSRSRLRQAAARLRGRS